MRCPLLLLVLFLSSAALALEPSLPTGAGPPALEFPHFPSRLHAFVWRNWNLIETDRLANVLETSADNLREDDFFFIKLGLLKPNCAKLTYAPPDESATARAAQIAKLIRENFPD